MFICDEKLGAMNRATRGPLLVCGGVLVSSDEPDRRKLQIVNHYSESQKPPRRIMATLCCVSLVFDDRRAPYIWRYLARPECCTVHTHRGTHDPLDCTYSSMHHCRLKDLGLFVSPDVSASTPSTFPLDDLGLTWTDVDLPGRIRAREALIGSMLLLSTIQPPYMFLLRADSTPQRFVL